MKARISCVRVRVRVGLELSNFRTVDTQNSSMQKSDLHVPEPHVRDPRVLGAHVPDPHVPVPAFRILLRIVIQTRWRRSSRRAW